MINISITVTDGSLDQCYRLIVNDNPVLKTKCCWDIWVQALQTKWPSQNLTNSIVGADSSSDGASQLCSAPWWPECFILSLGTGICCEIHQGSSACQSCSQVYSIQKCGRGIKSHPLAWSAVGACYCQPLGCGLILLGKAWGNRTKIITNAQCTRPQCSSPAFLSCWIHCLN